MRARQGTRFALALLLAGAATAAASDFKKSYADGLEAFNQQNWRELARHMQLAIDESPEENRAIRIYGMAFQPYVPHYFLGVARAEMGDCSGAMVAWRTSEDQGVVQKLPEYGDLQARRSVCLAPEVAKAHDQIRKARDSADRLSALARDPLLSGIWSREAFAGKEREATKLLESAVTGLDSAKNGMGVDEIRAAGQLAARAEQDLTAIYRQAEERRGELARAIESELQTRRQRIADLTPPARKLLDQAGRPGVSNALERELSELRRALDGASTAGSVTSSAELDRLLGRLSDAKGALESAVEDYRRGDPLRQEIEKLAADAGGVLLRARQLPASAGVTRSTAALEQALEAAATAGSVRAVTDLRGLRQRLADSTAGLQSAVEEYQSATPVRKQIEQLTREAASILERSGRLPSDAGVAPQRSAVQKALDAASGAGTVSSPAELEKTRRGLSDSMADLEGALREFQRAADLRERIRTQSGTARAALERARGVPGSGGVQTRASALERALEAASKAASVRSTGELEGLRRGLSDATDALEGAVDEALAGTPGGVDLPSGRPGPPLQLREAVRAYFGGDFGRALKILNEAFFDEGRAVLQAHLFRAAARYALYRLGGEQDEALLDAAAADVRDCRERDPDFEPDSEAFSPAFLDFYGKAGA